MCQILYLAPNAELPEKDIVNSVLNNPDGWGTVLKKGDKLNSRRMVTKGTDPDEVLKFINDNKEFERFVHLRFATKGLVRKDNVHPFEVFRNNKRRVLLMHNGTLKYFFNTAKPEVSDTYNFSHHFLKPLLKNYRVDGEKGKVDPLLKSIINKYRENSKFLIIRSDDTPLFLGDWGVLQKDNDGNVTAAAANTYSFQEDYRKPSSNFTNGWLSPPPPQKSQKGASGSVSSNSNVVPLTGVLPSKPMCHRAEKSGKPIVEFAFCTLEEVNLEKKTSKELEWVLAGFGLENLEDCAYMTQSDWVKLQQENPTSIPEILEQLSLQIHYLLEQ